MAAIFVASSWSDPPMPSSVPDVGLHGAAYFGLGAVLLRALARGEWCGVTPARCVAALVIATLYGVTDEWHQSFVPQRHPDVRDLVADATGAAAAVAAGWAWGIIRRL